MISSYKYSDSLIRVEESKGDIVIEDMNNTFSELLFNADADYLKEKLFRGFLKNEYEQAQKNGIKYAKTSSYAQASKKYAVESILFKKDLSRHKSNFEFIIDNKTVIIGLEDVLVNISLDKKSSYDHSFDLSQGSFALGTVFCYCINRFI